MWETDKYVEIIQHIPEQPMGQRRNQKQTEKLFQNKLKRKHSIPDHVRCCKSSLRGKFMHVLRNWKELK